MWELSTEEYLTLQGAYVNVDAAVNLLEAWAERKHSIEVSMIIEKIKPEIEACGEIFKKH